MTPRKGKLSPPTFLKKAVRIRSRQGLHARPAALFVQVAKRFKSTVKIRKGRQVVDGKSIMGLLSLAAGRGNTVELTLEGPDAEGAFHALEQIIAHDEAPAVVHVTRGHTSHCAQARGGASGSSSHSGDRI